MLERIENVNEQVIEKNVFIICRIHGGYGGGI